jgi:phosphoserine phosphatase
LGVADLAKNFPARWQKGEISYDEWAELDAALWRGYSRENIVEALELNPFRVGARELVEWFNSRSIPCVGISSGLSVFNDVTAAELKIKEIISNELRFEGDICSGKVAIQVNEGNKGLVMNEVLERYLTTEEQVVAFGDGVADIPLLQKAGLGVAICPSNEMVSFSAGHVVGEEPIDRILPFVEKHFKVG